MVPYKFCPYCGSKGKREKLFIQCRVCGKKLYENSPPCVGILIINGSKVLLSKRGAPPQKGKFDYPGGFLEKGEHPKDGAKREILEEAELKIEIVDFLGFYINNEYKYQGRNLSALDIVYVAKITGGKIKAQDDVKSLHWFPINNPPRNLAFTSVKKALQNLNNWYSNLNLKG